MDKKFTKELLVYSFTRALWTFLEAVLSCLTVGVAIWSFDWIHILSIAATAFLIAFIKCMLVGVPEAYSDGFMIVDDSDADRTRWLFDLNTDVEDIYKKKSISLIVKNKEEVK